MGPVLVTRRGVRADSRNADQRRDGGVTDLSGFLAGRSSLAEARDTVTSQIC
jgi:hypothetical protein